MTTLDRGSMQLRGPTGTTLQKVLLACGITYGLLYVVTNDLVAATLYSGYSRMDQAISELSATSAPTRGLLTAMIPVYTALMVAFGVGVWRAGGRKRALRATGGLLAAFGVIGVAWLPFPMTSREDMARGAMPAGDVGHLVLTAITVLLIVAVTVLGAAAIRRRAFRVYSAVTVVSVLAFGAWTGMQAPRIADGMPTSWMGLSERISAYGFMLWMAVFAVTLLRTRHGLGPEQTAPASGRPRR